ncbi:hypothetical protein NKY66_10815 [Sinorhizobium meliloti]|uniref:hypothetical protein n=1 Tax=Rhizobium meliloti TaxID=382 RepID=UPI003D6519D6
MTDSSVEEFLKNKERQSKEPEKGPGAVAIITTLIVLGALGYGGTKLYGAIRERQIAAEKKRQDEIAAYWAAQEAKQQKIADEKRQQIKNADRETLRKLVDSCKDQLMDIRSKSAFASNFPYYSPTELEKFAGMGTALNMPLGGYPSAALDNYDFDATAWNLDRISNKEYPITTISFVVEGAEDGFSVRQYAAVFSCELDGLKATEPERTQIYYLD